MSHRPRLSGARGGGWLASAIVILFSASLIVLATGCGGTVTKTTSERDSVAAGVARLKKAVPVQKKCEKLFSKLSKDLSAKKIATAATLKTRQAQVRACFGTVKKHSRAARLSLRSVLKANGVSESRNYSQKAVGEMPATAAASYVLILEAKSLNKKNGEAVGLVRKARLGVPLGASAPGDEPVLAINTLLFMQRYRTLLERTLKQAESL